MAQWGQGQSGFQYPMQTGYPPQFQQQQQFPGQNQTQFPGQTPQFQQNPSFLQQQQPGLAPQPTGFPGQRPPQFQQAQPTGFPGAQPPSQFVQRTQQTHAFLNAPPPSFAGGGGGGGGLAPQPTGFPSAAPLVAQPTGFIDPRLRMMTNTFMPMNTSAPYSAGGAPQLAPQQGSLQQSIIQHNQTQQGDSIQQLPWAITKSEKKQYNQLFRAWDTSNSGFISGSAALDVFGTSGLPKEELARIWYFFFPLFPTSAITHHQR
jgi:hypothetical protein